MKRLNNEEQKMYDRATKHTKPKELIVMVWWSFFNKKKMDKLHRCIMSGMHWNISYKLAKNLQ